MKSDLLYASRGCLFGGIIIVGSTGFPAVSGPPRPEGDEVPRPYSIVTFRGDRSMILHAGPLLANFWMYEEIGALGRLIPNDFVLFLALAGLLLTLLLDFLRS